MLPQLIEVLKWASSWLMVGAWRLFSLLALITSSCLSLFSSFPFVLSCECFVHECPMLLNVSHTLFVIVMFNFLLMS